MASGADPKQQWKQQQFSPAVLKIIRLRSNLTLRPSTTAVELSCMHMAVLSLDMRMMEWLLSLGATPCWQPIRAFKLPVPGCTPCGLLCSLSAPSSLLNKRLRKALDWCHGHLPDGHFNMVDSVAALCASSDRMEATVIMRVSGVTVTELLPTALPALFMLKDRSSDTGASNGADVLSPDTAMTLIFAALKFVHGEQQKTATVKASWEEVINGPTQSGGSLIHWVLRSGCTHAAGYLRVLVNQGVDPGLAWRQPSPDPITDGIEELTPPYVCVRMCRLDLFSALLAVGESRCRPDATPEGCVPLIHALVRMDPSEHPSSEDWRQALTLLVLSGGSVTVADPPGSGRTALMLACLCGSFNLVVALLDVLASLKVSTYQRGRQECMLFLQGTPSRHQV